MSAKRLVERTYSGLHESLAAHIASIPKDTAVLDVGCGTGAWLERLADMGFTNLHGIDADADQFACDRASFNEVDLNRDAGQTGNREYGLITAIEVIEHLENPGRLWSLVSKHLAQNGLFLLTTPNIQSLNARLRFLLSGALPAFDGKGDPTHIQPVHLEGAIRVMARYGLRIEMMWGYPSRGSRVFSKKVLLVGRLLSFFLADDVPGDTICLTISRCAE